MEIAKREVENEMLFDLRENRAVTEAEVEVITDEEVGAKI